MPLIDASLSPPDPEMLNNLIQVRRENRALMGIPANKDKEKKSSSAPRIQEVPPTKYSFENPLFQKTLTKSDSVSSLTTSETDTSSSLSCEENNSLPHCKITQQLPPSAHFKSANTEIEKAPSKSFSKKEELELAITKAEQGLASATQELKTAQEELEYSEGKKKNLTSEKKISFNFTFLPTSRSKAEPNKLEQRYQEKLLAQQQSIALLKKAKIELAEWEVEEAKTRYEAEKKKLPSLSSSSTEEFKAYGKLQLAQKRLQGIQQES